MPTPPNILQGLPNPKPGDAVRAADVLAISTAIVSLAKRLDSLESAAVLQGELARRLDCVIVAVNGATPIAGAGPAVDLRNVTYDVQPLGSDTVLAGVRPDFGRPWAMVGGQPLATGIPAAQNDRAVIFRTPDGTGAFRPLVFIQEYLVAGPVCPTQA